MYTSLHSKCVLHKLVVHCVFDIIFETCVFCSEKVRKLTEVSLDFGAEKSVGTWTKKEHESFTGI